jgi:hypothetical protein
MQFYQIPYYIQAALADEGFLTMADIAMRWPSPSKVREEAPKDYKFEDGSAGYTKASSLRTAIRLQQLVEAATLKKDNAMKQVVEDKTWDAQATLPQGQRTAMEAQWVLKTKLPKPSLDEQGSDHYLGMQYKLCARGEIGFFTNKQIISQLPETSESLTYRKKRRTDNDGIVHEHDEEERQDPTTMDQWKKQMMVFRTSLLFCAWMFPQHPKLQISKEVLDELYKFIYGPSIATRTPAPSVAVLMRTERKVWRQIAMDLHEGLNLNDAIKKAQTDYLFWQREVYERCTHTVASSSEKSGHKGKGKGKPAIHKGKGKGRKGQKTKGTLSTPQSHQSSSSRSKGQSPMKPTWPATWAQADPKGKPFCKNYFLFNGCAGGCGRSHQCPVVKKDNATCMGNHTPDNCPNK